MLCPRVYCGIRKYSLRNKLLATLLHLHSSSLNLEEILKIERGPNDGDRTKLNSSC